MSQAETISSLITDIVNLSTEPISAERMVALMDLYQFVKETEAKNGGAALPPAPAPRKKAAPLSLPKEKAPEAAELAPNSFSGTGGGEKREAHGKLKAYRAAHGLGCLKELADNTGGTVTVDELRMMLDAAPMPIAKWRALSAAIDFLEGKSK